MPFSADFSHALEFSRFKLGIMNERVTKPPSSLRPLATLSSLPEELLKLIAHYLPTRSSAINFALTSRQFVQPAETRIWRDIDASLSSNFGEYPLVQPHARSGIGAHVTWAETEAKAAEMRRRTGLREKVKEILFQANRERAGMVERLSLVPRPGAMTAILQLLDCLSPTLKELHIHPLPQHVFEASWRPADYDSLDTRIIGSDLTFTSLTNIRIIKGSVRFVDFIVELVDSSPNLISLDADVSDISKRSIIPSTSPPFRSLMCETKVRSLLLQFGDLFGVSANDHPMVTLIERSSCLRTASIRYIGHDDATHRLALLHLSRKQDLADLHYWKSPCDFNKITRNMYGFQSLKRLLLRCPGAIAKAFVNLFDHTPQLPNLERLYLDYAYDSDFVIEPNAAFAEPLAVESMMHTFSNSLRFSPKLRLILPAINIVGTANSDPFIHLDKLEASKQCGIIRSWRYGGKELFHARLFHQFATFTDTLTHTAVTKPAHSVSIDYDGSGGEKRTRVFRYAEEEAYRDYTAYEGVVVPLEVIQQMRWNQGVKAAAWEGRGITVSAKCWKFLEDWREMEREAEREKEKATKKLNTSTGSSSKGSTSGKPRQTLLSGFGPP